MRMRPVAQSKSDGLWASVFWLFVLVGGLWWVADYARDKIASPGATRTSTAPGPTAPASIAPKLQPPQLLAYPTTQLDLYELTMSKSRTFTVSGDLRPIWTVRGRIRNHTAPACSIKEVRLHIRIYDAAGNEADSALLTVVMLIPPQDTVLVRAGYPCNATIWEMDVGSRIGAGGCSVRAVAWDLGTKRNTSLGWTWMPRT